MSEKGNNNELYNRLRCIHRLSNNIYAEIIYDKHENIWGIFVVDIDINNNNRFFENDDMCNTMSKTVRTISISLNHVK